MSKSARCPLLELPGELINRVYQLVLVKDTPLRVSTHTFPQEPPLLLTNKGVHREAMSIYYGENTFDVDLSNYDCAASVKWSSRVASLRQTSNVRMKCRVDMGLVPVTPSWTNLVKWLERYYQDQTQAYILPLSQALTEFQSDLRIAGMMFRVVDQMRSQDWELVREVLEGVPSFAHRGAWAVAVAREAE